MGEPKTTLTAVTSFEGWGAHVEVHTVGGCWIEGEADKHINVLKLKAILFGLKSLLCIPPSHVRVFTKAMAYIRTLGSNRSKVCNVTKLIWDWAQQHNVWLTVAYIPGIQN